MNVLCLSFLSYKSRVSLVFLLVLLFLPLAAFGQSAAAPEEALARIDIDNDGPAAPAINSETFGAPDDWQNITEGTFTWQLPADVVAVSVEVSTTSGREPVETFRPPINEIVLGPEDLTEGVQYLAVQFRNEEKWGQISERVIKVDTTPPEPFNIDVGLSARRPGSVVTFNAEDELSGIDHYELYVADRPPITISLDDAKRGYFIEGQTVQPYMIRVVAYDRAGNSTESALAILPTAMAGTIKVPDLMSQLLSAAPLLVGLLTVLVLALFVYLIAERRRYAAQLSDLRIETMEIQVQLTKIFSALRDEIYDQIRSITKRPRLTKNEKEAVDGLNKALEVSETLIEKEIKDVKNILD